MANSGFEEDITDKIGPQLISSQVRAIDIMSVRNTVSTITIGDFLLLQIRGCMSWRAISHLMIKFFMGWKAANIPWTARLIAEAPIRLMSKLDFPPLIFRVPGPSEPRENWLVSSHQIKLSSTDKR